MRRALRPGLLLALAVTVLAGCGSKHEGKLEGTSWGSEPWRYGSRDRPAGYFKLYFKHDKRLVYLVGGEAYAGKFRYGTGDLVIFEFDRPLSGMKTHTERIWFEGDRMVKSDVLKFRTSFKRLRTTP